MNESTIVIHVAVDLVFPVAVAEAGEPILPVDHAYALFSALCGIMPELHGDRHIGIHPIPGRLLGQRRMYVERWSRLTMRVPADRIGSFVPLAGQVLRIEDTRLALGPPYVRPLRPSRALRSRLVVIRGFTEPESFLDAARRQISGLGIRDAEVRLVPRRGDHPRERGLGGHEPWVRRTLHVHGREIVGYALDVDGLTDEESLLLQTVGIGGRRRFGCGLFLPRKEW